MSNTRGVVFVHSAPAVLCPHVEWALSGCFGAPIRLEWATQPVLPGTHRAEYTWRGPQGTSSAIASALNRWQRLRFEVTEEGTANSDAQRYSYTPSLGIFTATTNRFGEIQASESQLAQALRDAAGDMEAFEALLDDLLGVPWDQELEPFRMGEAIEPPLVRVS